MKKILIILIAIVLLIIIIAILVFYRNSSIIFQQTFYYSMGSLTLRIYNNGDVYEDKEIEEPNHKPNFKKIKKLSESEIEELKQNLNKSGDELKKYISNLIYGDENYDLTPNVNFSF